MNELRAPKPLRKTELKRFLRSQTRPAGELVLLLIDVEDPVNVGSIFRMADALSVEEVILSGISATPPHKLISKVGRNKHERVAFRQRVDPVSALRELKAAGFHLRALELTQDAVPYDTAHYPERLALIVGHEDHGVPKKALAEVDDMAFIPMYGKGASLNVHMALGIVAFHALATWRAQSAPEGTPSAGAI